MLINARASLLAPLNGDMLSARDFGAQGDGIADDGPAIQRCFNAAFGPPNNPHGAAASLNRPVFIPAGKYLIGQQLFLNRTNGSAIIGAGHMATRFVYTGAASNLPGGNATSLLTCLSTDFTRIQGITFDVTGSNAICAVQLASFLGFLDDGKSITWIDCGFVGASDAGLACTIDGTGQTGSEMLFICCTFDSCTHGTLIASGNALNFVWIAPRFVNCVRSIHCPNGSFDAVIGGSFDNPSYATFTGTFSGGAHDTPNNTSTSTLTASGGSVTGALQVGQLVKGAGVTIGTRIVSGSGLTWTVQYAGAIVTPGPIAMIASGLDIYIAQANCPAILGCSSTSPNFCEGGPISVVGCTHTPSVGGGLINWQLDNQDSPQAMLEGNYMGPNSGLYSGNISHLAYLFGNATSNSGYLSNFGGTAVRNL